MADARNEQIPAELKASSTDLPLLAIQQQTLSRIRPSSKRKFIGSTAIIIGSLSLKTPSSGSDSTGMSSRNRGPRSGGRGGTQDTGEENQIWLECQNSLNKIAGLESESKVINQKIFALERTLKEAESSTGKSK
jgi:hypothetical protein